MLGDPSRAVAERLAERGLTIPPAQSPLKAFG